MVNEWLLDNLACPRDHTPLTVQDNTLVCASGHGYPIYDGIPVLLRDDVAVNHPALAESLEQVKSANPVPAGKASEVAIDPYVQKFISATNGHLYADLVGKLKQYPIPDIRLSETSMGQVLLDIGCSWGRWSISAARKGYFVVGIDPWLDAILAARRVAQQLGFSNVAYVVADARYLPFRSQSFDCVFSYSVLQHFSKEDVRATLASIAITLKPGGKCLIQMPNQIGIRNLYNMLTKSPRSRENPFRVRYWGLSELKETFSMFIGTTTLSIDGFFGLGIQPADLPLLSRKAALVVRSSETLRQLSKLFPWMIAFADSVYVDSTGNGA